MRKIIIFSLVSIFIFSGCTKANLSGKEANGTITSELSIHEIFEKILTKENPKSNLMEINYSEEMIKIMSEFQESMKNNSEWFNEYIKENSEKTPLPYHENFGITKKEYLKVLNSEKYMTLRKTNTIDISLEQVDEGKYSLVLDNDEVGMNKFQIDINANTVHTEFGKLDFAKKVEASEDQKLTGKWYGYTWKLEESNIDLENLDISNINEETKIKMISLSIGQKIETDEQIIYYKLTIIENGKKYKEDKIFFIN